MDLIDDPAPGRNVPEFTVGEIAGTVKRLIEGELGYVRVRGEVGRVVRARSGHLYFDLKDDRNVLSCMTWKGQIPDLDVMPEEGLEVVAEGRMTASGFQSKFSLNATRVQVAGQGALMAMLEKRRATLAAEGLFDEARKRPLPFLPEIIGVVTSPQGAVIRDILHRLRDRFPRKVLIWPVAVQGQACAPEVARAIEGFNRLTPGGTLPRPDLLIVARGGGSIEDLWGFNEEAVVRAAAASDIPLISAVGHETDTTLIDYASDLRAPTPTAAAERAVPVRSDLLARTAELDARLRRAIAQRLDRSGERLRDLSRPLSRPEAVLETPRQRLDAMAERLPSALGRGVERRRTLLAQRTGALRPSVLQGTLQRQRQAFASSAAQLDPALRRATKDRARDLDALSRRLPPALARGVTARRDRFRALAARHHPENPARSATQARRALSQTVARLERTGRQNLVSLHERLASLLRIADSVSYKATLARGYAVVRDGDGTVISASPDAKAARMLRIEFADGDVTLGNIPTRRPKASQQGPDDQGSLF